jgi:hypothetical protein
MRLRVKWPNGNEREVNVNNLRELDKVVGWYMQEDRNADLRLDGEGMELVLSKR